MIFEKLNPKQIDFSFAIRRFVHENRTCGPMPQVLLIHPASYDEFLFSMEKCISDYFANKNDKHVFMGVRIIRSTDIPEGTFELF